MSKGIKIATIGGGSGYTPELVEGFIKRYDELPVREQWLVDIEEGKEKLEVVGNLAKRMVKKAGVPMEIKLTLDRCEALKDNDKKDIQTLNVQNNGAIAGIPNESAVEVSCIVTKEGPKPITVGELPVHVNGLVQQIKSFERVAAEAAVTGSYEKALLAMAINPLVPSDELAKTVLDELLEAHKDYLPQFFKKEAVC
jgi:alpha-galactosidase/6-phospho-beta-glucosidase family protein